MTNEPEAATVKVPANPFMQALLAIAVIGLIAWAIAGFFVLQAAQDHTDASTASTWAGLGGTVGYSALLVWLLASALTWKPAK